MNIFGCWLLFGLVSIISLQLVSVCKSVSSTKSIENRGETNNQESILFYKEMQNLKGDGCQKGDEGKMKIPVKLERKETLGSST